MKAARLLLLAALGFALVFAITSDAQQPSSLNKELRTAAQEGNVKWVDTLLDEGAVTEELALLEAARYGRTNVVKFLLDRGANIETDDWSRDTPLILAAIYGRVDTLNLLLDRGANPHSKGDREGALLQTAGQGQPATIALLLRRATFTLKEKKEALFEAAEREPLSIDMEMPPGGLPPDPNRGTYLGGLPPKPDPLKPLVPLPFPPPPDWAGAVKVLLQDGAMSVDVRDDYDQETPLIHAAGFGQTGTVKMLLDMGATVDARARGGDTALLGAACNCAITDMPDTLESMKLLLAAKANVDARTNAGETPLMAAAAYGQMDNAKLLLDHGAKIDARDNQGDTALTLAARADYGEQAGTVRLLVERGANVNAKDPDGDTPLILLASAPYYNGNNDTTEMVRVLLAHGADPRTINRKGQSALTLTKESGQRGVARLLEGALAKSQ